MSSQGFNLSSFSGNLAADVEVKSITTRSGSTTKVASGVIYVRRPSNREQSFTVALNIWEGSSAWGTLPYLVKGALIIASGSVEDSPYIATDGSPRSGMRMNVNSLTLDIVPRNEDEDEEPVANKPKHSSNDQVPKKEYAAVDF
ncbi:single-stranded DNA-binding protein [Leptolyngbya sp. AN02str]|uniref:single-stranded DNA-binding protein n=1 Tax=Leptolyngbya sp. AN02str TaxID=3423363 RepID=UPI003D317D6D